MNRILRPDYGKNHELGTQLQNTRRPVLAQALLPPGLAVFTDNERRDTRKGSAERITEGPLLQSFIAHGLNAGVLACQPSLIHRTEFIAGFGHSNNRGIKVKLKLER